MNPQTADIAAHNEPGPKPPISHAPSIGAAIVAKPQLRP